MTDVGKIIESSGCATEYFALEECLGETDRDFRACKPAMDALKRCSDAQRLKKAAAAAAKAEAAAGAGAGASQGRGGGSKAGGGSH